jgi:hypothetical protein
MTVEKKNSYGKEEAKKKIENLISKFKNESFPGGVTVSEVEQEWNGDQLNFSFKAKKGFLGTTVKGKVGVTEEKIVLDTEIPGLVKNFVNEDQIKSVIQQKMDEYL